MTLSELIPKLQNKAAPIFAKGEDPEVQVIIVKEVDGEVLICDIHGDTTAKKMIRVLRRLL